MNSDEVMREIERLRRQLKPRQLFRFWIRTAPRFESVSDCAAWMVDQVTDGADKISQLAAEAGSAVRGQFVDREWSECEEAVTQAKAKIFFLYFLYINLNVHVGSQVSVCQERCAKLIPTLSRALELGRHLVKLRSSLSSANGDKTLRGKPVEDGISRSLAVWEAQLEDLMKEGEWVRTTVAEMRLVAEIITRHYYYSGDPMLWNGTSVFLEGSGPEPNTLMVLEDTLRGAEQFVRTTGIGSPDPSCARDTSGESTEVRAREIADRLVTISKVDALRCVGKREKARELLLRKIKEEGDRQAEAEALLGLGSTRGPGLGPPSIIDQPRVQVTCSNTSTHLPVASRTKQSAWQAPRSKRA